jgi:ketosteroid isomerase-like protein
MASSELNVELARRSISAWIAGDRESTLAMMADDVEVFVPSELANTGAFRGKEEFRSWIAEWDEAWADLKLEVQDVDPVGERHVIASIRQRATGRGSGIPVEMDIAFLTEVRDDKIAGLHLYATVDEARRVAEQRESA